MNALLGFLLAYVAGFVNCVASGIVLTDRDGNRKAETMIDPSGIPRIKIQPPGEEPREV